MDGARSKPPICGAPDGRRRPAEATRQGANFRPKPPEPLRITTRPASCRRLHGNLAAYSFCPVSTRTSCCLRGGLRRESATALFHQLPVTRIDVPDRVRERLAPRFFPPNVPCRPDDRRSPRSACRARLSLPASMTALLSRRCSRAVRAAVHRITTRICPGDHLAAVAELSDSSE